MRWPAPRRNEEFALKLHAIVLTLVAAVAAAAAGLVLSIRINGPGPLPGTAAGRWLVERVAPAQGASGIAPAANGELVGSLSLTDLSGQPQQLPPMRGHRVLINLWASWCGPCRDEMPLLAGLARVGGPGKIDVIGIAQDDPASVRSYLLRTPVNYPILLDDAQGRAGLRLGDRLGALPYSVLLDGNGRLLRRKYGPFADAKALATWASGR